MAVASHFEKKNNKAESRSSAAGSFHIIGAFLTKLMHEKPHERAMHNILERLPFLYMRGHSSRFAPHQLFFSNIKQEIFSTDKIESSVLILELN